jgi:hypothetical protein
MGDGMEQVKDRVMREMTVGESIDHEIEKALRLVSTLRDLRNNLPAGYLDSGVSRIQPFRRM